VIVSHKHRFIFVKRAKTAGTSIEVMLSPLCGPADVFTPVDPPEEDHHPRNFDDLREKLLSLGDARASVLEHLPASVIKKCLPDCWSQYCSFCVERNPWDKLVSSYHYYLAQPDTKKKLDFNAYVRFGMSYFGDCHDYIDENGRILVDRVLRYEHLDADLQTVFADLRIPFTGKLQVRAKSGHRPRGDDYRTYYDSATRDVVARNYAWEIEHFQYSF
jgi:hypothetical protein